jgi:hypothetical protein
MGCLTLAGLDKWGSAGVQGFACFYEVDGVEDVDGALDGRGYVEPELLCEFLQLHPGVGTEVDC